MIRSMIEVVMSVLSVIFAMLPFALPLVYFSQQNRRWIPGNAGRSVGIRRFESCMLLLGVSLVGILWLYDGIPTTFMPRRFGEGYSAAIRTYHGWAVAFGSMIGLMCIWIAWRVNTSVTFVFLIFAGLTGSVLLQLKIRLQEQHEWTLKHTPPFASEGVVSDELPPVRIRFELAGNLPGADLWINGTYLGKTPYATTDRELFAKVATWDDQEVSQHRDSNKPEDTFLTPQGGQIRRWGWCPIHFLSRQDPAMKLYYKVDLNGTPGFSSIVSQKSQGPTDTSPLVQVITLDTVFPTWEVAIEELLDWARSNAYQVNAAWLEAFDSYGKFADNQLEKALRIEPQLEKVRIERARFANNLQVVHDSVSAWQRLMQIENDARTNRSYDSASSAGIAVELLVPWLDPEQLVEHAIALLKATPNPDPLSLSTSGNHFATYHDGKSSYGSEVALWPIAHAIWLLDQRLDAERARDELASSMSAEVDPQTGLAGMLRPDLDNLVEQRITPLLMQLSFQNPGRLQYAGLLGGSVYERFLLRNDWRSAPSRNGAGPYVGDFQNPVNIWFYRLMWLRSQLGKSFRQQQSREILKIARGGLTDFAMSSGSFPPDLDFLFLDREFTPEQPSLAMKMWYELDSLANGVPKHARSQMLRMRWDYLARMWPESTPQMFISALQQAIAADESLSLPEFHSSLPANSQFEILQALLDAELERVAKLPADLPERRFDGPKYRGEQLISVLKSKLRLVPCDAAARRLVQEAASDAKHFPWDWLSAVLKYDTQHEDLLRQFAEAEVTNLQLAILPAIEHHPTPGRQALLERLLTAKDERVRAGAVVVKRKLTELRTRSFMHRTPSEPAGKVESIP